MKIRGCGARLIHCGGLAVLLAPSFAAAQQETGSAWRVQPSSYFAYGPVSGYMQIPLGGNPASSDRGRPTFDELAIQDQEIYDAALDVSKGAYGFYAGDQVIRLSGSGTLGEDLLSRNQTFHAGEHFRTDDKLDWSRFGVTRSFSPAPRVELKAGAEFALLDFGYDVHGESNRVARYIRRGALRFGVEGIWHASARWSVDASASASVPVTSQPQISVVNATARYRLNARASLFAGTGFERIEYKDDQPLPNHIKADLGPLAMLGISVAL